MFADCRDYLKAVASVAGTVDQELVTRLRAMVFSAAERGAMIFIAGNGGNATIADHMALGLTLNAVRESGRGARAVALNSSGAVLSAAANDFGVERMFAAQLEAMARPGDLFLALSASGTSRNIEAAVERAHTLGVETVVIVGNDGPASWLADLTIYLQTDQWRDADGRRSAVCSAVFEDVAIMLLHWVYGSYMDAGRTCTLALT